MLCSRKPSECPDWSEWIPHRAPTGGFRVWLKQGPQLPREGGWEPLGTALLRVEVTVGGVLT